MALLAWCLSGFSTEKSLSLFCNYVRGGTCLRPCKFCFFRHFSPHILTPSVDLDGSSFTCGISLVAFLLSPPLDRTIRTYCKGQSSLLLIYQTNKSLTWPDVDLDLFSLGHHTIFICLHECPSLAILNIFILAPESFQLVHSLP